MSRFIADQENYAQNDKVILTAMLETYTNLYNKACTEKNYALCHNLRMEISNILVGYPARIKLEDKLFDV